MTAAGRDHQRIVCIGGAVVDRTYRSLKPVVAGTSNPARSRLGFGGVGRNVSENLARLGIQTALVSRVGDDASGRALVEHAMAAGIDVSAVERVPGAATAEYVAVMEPDGTLAFGIADMALLDGITHESIAAVGPLIAGARHVFADGNLGPLAMAALSSRCRAEGVPLAVDAVSTPKAARLPADLSGIAVLFLNEDEAAAMVPGAYWQREDLAAALRQRGCQNVVLTAGAAGCIVADAAGMVRVPAVAAEVADVTGAGDALVAGTLAGLTHGQPLRTAVTLGTTLAARAVACAASVAPDLSPALLTRLIAALPRISDG